MPRQSRSQLIGYEGEHWFRTQLPNGWIPQQPQPDLGIDFIIVICEEGFLNGREFRVQIKASSTFKTIGSNLLVPGIKRSTLEYWFKSHCPTMLVAYHTNLKQGFYSWHHVYTDDLYREPLSPLLVLSVPNRNSLDASAWSFIRDNLISYYNESDKLTITGFTHGINSTAIFGLAGVVKILTIIDGELTHSQIASDLRRGFPIIEMLQHNHVISVVETLINKYQLSDSVSRGFEGRIKYLRDWVSAYKSKVKSVYPTFESFATDGFTLPVESPEFVFIRHLATEHRLDATKTILDLIRMLTKEYEFRIIDNGPSRLDLSPDD